MKKAYSIFAAALCIGSMAFIPTQEAKSDTNQNEALDVGLTFDTSVVNGNIKLNVKEGSIAEKAGIENNDVLTEINGQGLPVDISRDDIIKLILDEKGKVILGIWRNGSLLKVQLPVLTNKFKFIPKSKGLSTSILKEQRSFWLLYKEGTSNNSSIVKLPMINREQCELQGAILMTSSRLNPQYYMNIKTRTSPPFRPYIVRGFECIEGK